MVVVDEIAPAVDVLTRNGGEYFESLDAIAIEWIVNDDYLKGTECIVYLDEHL